MFQLEPLKDEAAMFMAKERFFNNFLKTVNFFPHFWLLKLKEAFHKQQIFFRIPTFYYFCM
jgi:hypothetical protein